MNSQTNGKRLNVLVITNLFPNPEEPLRGIFVANITDELRKQCNVTVISPLPWFPKLPAWQIFKSYEQFSRVPYEFKISEINVYSPKYLALPKLGFMHTVFIFIALFRLVKKLKVENKVEIINAHWVFPDGVAVAWIAKILRIPLVITAHGCDINLYSTFPLRRGQIINALKTASKVTVVSNALKQKTEALGIPEDHVTVFMNGLEHSRFNLKDKEECRRMLGLDSDVKKKVILFVGQIIEVKGINYLIEAARKMVRKNGCGFRILAIGAGVLRAGYEQYIKEHSLNEVITFVGEKSRDEIPLWFGACDVFCLPSIREGCPNVVLEALSSGRPVVASRVGGIPDLLNAENGILVTSTNVDELADALSTAMTREWDDAGIRSSVADLTWESIAQKYADLFRKLVNK